MKLMFKDWELVTVRPENDCLHSRTISKTTKIFHFFVSSKENSATTKKQKNYSYYYWTRTSCICNNIASLFICKNWQWRKYSFVTADNSNDVKICVSYYTAKMTELLHSALSRCQENNVKNICKYKKIYISRRDISCCW